MTGLNIFPEKKKEKEKKEEVRIGSGYKKI